MRTFIAIELPKEIKDILARLQEQLKNAGADVKWVKPANIHLTLKFLGEIDDRKLKEIAQALQDFVKDINVFYIRLFSVGAFPKINSPRVIWVGIDKGDQETKEIVMGLEEKLYQAGIPKEDRPFSSHITLGRVRSGLNRDKLAKILEILSSGFKVRAEFLAGKVTLFKSTLTPQGPIYEAIKELNLKIS